jgi:hypothetical protein
VPWILGHPFPLESRGLHGYLVWNEVAPGIHAWSAATNEGGTTEYPPRRGRGHAVVVAHEAAQVGASRRPLVMAPAPHPAGVTKEHPAVSRASREATLGCTSFASSDTAMPWPGPLRNGTPGRSLIGTGSVARPVASVVTNVRHDTRIGHVSGSTQHRCDTVPDTVPVAPSSAIRCCGPSATTAPGILSLRSASELLPPRRSDRKVRVSRLHLMRHPRSSTAPAGRRLRVHADGAVAPEDGLCLHPAPADPAEHHLRPAAAPEPQAHPSDVQLEESPVVRRVSSEGAGSGPSVLAYLSRLRARTTTYPCSFSRGGAIQRC